jgi:hypothetical protein
LADFREFREFSLDRKRPARPVPPARSTALGPILIFKNGVWEFQEVKALEASLVQPGHRINVIMA